MKNLFTIIFAILYVGFISCQSLKQINENDLKIYNIAKNEIKSSDAFSNFIQKEIIDCEQIEVSNFLTSPCHSFQYIDEDIQKKIYNIDCEYEVNTWGESYKNIDKLSDSKPHCIKLFFSEIIQGKYIIAEIEKSNHLPFYSSLMFVLEIKDGEIEILDTGEIIYE